MLLGTIALIDISTPDIDAKIRGKINASEFLSGLFKSKRMTIKNILVANVAEENSSLSLYCKFSKANGGVFFENPSHTK